MTHTPAFKPGQRIKALHSSYVTDITEGKVYTVLSCEGRGLVMCKFDRGTHYAYVCRFVPCYDSVFESDLYAYLDEELL